MSRLQNECLALRERLPELAEGVLGGRRRAQVERHVASCPRCAAELAELRVILSSLRQLSPAPMPPGLLESLRREVARRTGPPLRQPVSDWVRLVVASAAAGMAVALTLVFCFRIPAPSLRSLQAVGQWGPSQAGQKQGVVTTQPSLALPGAQPAKSAARESVESPSATPAKPSPPAPSLSPPLVTDSRAQIPVAFSAGLSEQKGPAPAASLSPAPVRATLGAAEGSGALSIILRPTGQPVARAAMMAERGGARILLWRGELRGPTTIILSPRLLGTGPGAIPLVLESAAGTARWVLFVPVLSRLGETASSLPALRYRGEPLGRAFASISELSGLLLLVEGPLDRPVRADLPAGDPDLVLSRLAALAGLEVKANGRVLRTVARPSQD